MKLINLLMSIALLAANQLILVTGSTLPPGLPTGKSLPGGSAMSPAGFDGYEMVTATFIGTILGQNFKLNGTVQEVLAQLQDKHHTVNLSSRNIVGVGGSSTNPAPNDIGKRSKVLPPICIPVAGQKWNFAYGYATDDGIRSLNKIGGRVGINKKQCARLSCISASAIYICNDNNKYINPDLRYIASYAYDLRHRCRLQPPGVGFDLCGGQEFDTDSYNVIVHDAIC